MIEFLQNLPPEIATFFLSMIPIFELRGAIPIAIGVFDLPVWKAVFFSIIGDIVPAIFIVLLLKPLSEWLSSRFDFCKRFFDWWFNRVVKKFAKKYEKYGVWALMVFVAIPLPITGAWTGAAASFLFEIPKKKAIVFITLGAIISAFIVAGLATGIFVFF